MIALGVGNGEVTTELHYDHHDEITSVFANDCTDVLNLRSSKRSSKGHCACVR